GGGAPDMAGPGGTIRYARAGRSVLPFPAMTVLRRLWTAVAAGALLLAPLAVTGCGNGGNGPAKMAKVESGDMPSGAEWTGVYFSELYGNLHLVAEGNTIHGKWIRPVKDRWGELHGTATGDVIHFEWIEHTVG